MCVPGCEVEVRLFAQSRSLAEIARRKKAVGKLPLRKIGDLIDGKKTKHNRITGALNIYLRQVVMNSR